MEIPFVKLHGNGNDFILIDEYKDEKIPDDLKAHFASVFCDRKFGIGGDGVLFLQKSGDGIRMRLFQPDESEAEMCGNGIRCLAKYAFDNGYVKSPCIIQTLAGPVNLKVEYDEDGDFIAEVEMTEPVYDCPGIPAKGKGDFHEIINGYEVFAVNTGVPHAVVFVRDLEMVDMVKAALPIRHSQFFPSGVNVNFVEVTGEDSIKIRTFERGVEGETLSCGTGATASAAIAHRLAKTGPVVEVETIGGPLTITINNGAFMNGPADTVFSGILSIEE
ncbi:diaminopimelate epimerase [Methanospirillum sp.]|jgi:diaminopimelate epimerase|uniref:diaminopimelate epimerase n=1 Tax=Methanospirillum sp. TaxID=45200 RepID=UPI00359F4EAD